MNGLSLKFFAFQIHMVVKHVVGFQSLPVDTLSFLLTLLSSVVTPVFVLSKRWTHLPCGCIINCQPDTYSGAFDGKKCKSSPVAEGEMYVHSNAAKDLLRKLLGAGCENPRTDTHGKERDEMIKFQFSVGEFKQPCEILIHS